MTIRNRPLQEELQARAHLMDTFYQEILEKERLFDTIKFKLDFKEKTLENKYIESSRVMVIAEKYTDCWDTLREYHNSNILKRTFFDHNIKMAYKEVRKRLHCDGIPDIKITLEQYLDTYEKLKTVKRHVEGVRYKFDLAIDCFSDFLDTL